MRKKIKNIRLANKKLKCCCTCKVVKSLAEFNADSCRRDGYDCQCKMCSNVERTRRRATPVSRQHVSEYWHKYHEAKKMKVLSHYGIDGECKCVRCGESRIVCLSLDHINGDGYLGAEPGTKSGHYGRRMSSGQLYSYVVKNDYPKGYQTLCMNCQFVKRAENKEYSLIG